jgi:hypothetical protein
MPDLVHEPWPLITAQQLAEKYPVELVTASQIWGTHLKFWRDNQLLVLDRHWMVQHVSRVGRPQIGYVEPCVLFLVRRDAKEDEFCHLVYRAHKPLIIACIRDYVASCSK